MMKAGSFQFTNGATKRDLWNVSTYQSWFHLLAHAFQIFHILTRRKKVDFRLM